MNLTIIAAVSENNVIGVNGKIPWRIKDDMIRFKELTLNHPVIIGRRTYETLPERFRPLPQRKNIVLSRNMQSERGVYAARTIDEALELAGTSDSYIIGGAQVYELFLPFSERIEFTKVYRTYLGENILFFPYVNWNEWDLTNRDDKSTDDELGKIEYSFLTYRRK